MNNNLDFQFGMYEPTIDSIIFNAGKNSILVISCKDIIQQLSLMVQIILSIFTACRVSNSYICQACTERKQITGLCGFDK